MGGKDRVIAKGLRGLRPVKPGTVARAGHLTCIAPPKRIGHRQGRGSTLPCGKRRHQPVDQGRRHQWPRAVMDQHPQDSGSPQRLKPREDRGIARRPAFDQPDLGAKRKRFGPRPVIAVDDQHHRQTTEGCKRVRKDRLAGKRLPLFGQIAAHPAAAARSHDDDGCVHALLLRPCS